MILYITIPILVLLMAKKINQKNMTVLDFGLLFLLIVVCGFRKNVGTDYIIYRKMYSNTDIFPHLEELFKTIIIVLNKFNVNFETFIFIIALITIMIFYKVFKERSPKPVESIMLFICLGYYAHCFNTIRQMLAVAVTVYAFKYIKEKKIFKYSMCIMIATFIHTSAVIMLPFYFIVRRDFKKKFLYLLYILMFLGGVLYQPVLNFIVNNFERFSSYININNYTYSIAGLGTVINMIVHLILVFWVIYIKDGLMERNKDNKYYVNTIVFSNLFYIMALKNTVAVRFAYYFSIYLVLLLPEMFKVTFKKNYANNMVVVICFCLIYYIAHIMSFNQMLPYNSIFF